MGNPNLEVDDTQIIKALLVRKEKSAKVIQICYVNWRPLVSFMMTF